MIRVATVFSGIGAPEAALKRLGIEHEIVFACDNGDVQIEYDLDEELEKIGSFSFWADKKRYVDDLYNSKTKRTNWVKKSYLANYPIDPERFFLDVKLLDGRDFKDQVDLLIGGSPCQAFSECGWRKGFTDRRGQLFFDFCRLVDEIQPKVFIWENVKGVLFHDKGNTWKVIQESFNNLGYHWHWAVLNAKDYGIPQSRPRVFVVGFKNDIPYEFPPKQELKLRVQDLLEHDVPDKYTLSQKRVDFIFKPHPFNRNPKLNPEIAPCLTKTEGRASNGVYICKSED